jgi:hypothetical protein
MGWFGKLVGVIGGVIIGNNSDKSAQYEAVIAKDEKKIKSQKTVIYILIVSVLTLGGFLVFKLKKNKK